MMSHGGGHKHYQKQQKKHENVDKVISGIQTKVRQYENKGLKHFPAEDLVQSAQQMGEHLKKVGLKTTQIRKFLDGVRKLDISFERGNNFNKEQVILLKPKLAYAAGRQSAVKPLMEVLDPAITAAQESYESFRKLVAFIEGIIAYHKYYGGKDS